MVAVIAGVTQQHVSCSVRHLTNLTRVLGRGHREVFIHTGIDVGEVTRGTVGDIGRQGSTTSPYQEQVATGQDGLNTKNMIFVRSIQLVVCLAYGYIHKVSRVIAVKAGVIAAGTYARITEGVTVLGYE